jgi:hypothetical protein
MSYVALGRQAMKRDPGVASNGGMTSAHATIEVASSAYVRGRTVRFAWTDGPTQGTTHEHRFHHDGTVEWHAVGVQAIGDQEPASERPEYFAADVGDESCFVSYLSKKSGYTLSLVLNFVRRTIVGVASNGKQWMPVRGHLDVVA